VNIPDTTNDAKFNATGNASYANLSVNTNLTGQLRSRNRPLSQ